MSKDCLRIGLKRRLGPSLTVGVLIDCGTKPVGTASSGRGSVRGGCAGSEVDFAGTKPVGAASFGRDSVRDGCAGSDVDFVGTKPRCFCNWRKAVSAL